MSGTVQSRKTFAESIPANGGHHGVAALREDQRVIVEPRLPFGSPSADALSLPVYLHRLGIDEHLHPVAALEALGCLKEELRAFLDVPEMK